jgi:hypothetical protein
MPQTERNYINRRRFGSALAGAGAGALAYAFGARIEVPGLNSTNPIFPIGGRDGVPNNGENDPNKQVAPTEPSTPTPDFDRLATENFQKIEQAADGEIIDIPNLVVAGLRRDTLRIPFNTITEETALVARIGSDGKTTVITGFMMGSECLFQQAEQENRLEGIKPFDDGSTPDLEAKIWQFKEPMVLGKVTVSVGRPISGQEGGRILHLQSYKRDNESDEVRCRTNTDDKDSALVELKYLTSQEIRSKLHPK